MRLLYTKVENITIANGFAKVEDGFENSLIRTKPFFEKPRCSKQLIKSLSPFVVARGLKRKSMQEKLDGNAP